MNISPETLKQRLDEREKGGDDFVLLDVRNPNEQEIAIIPGTDLEISKLNNYKMEGKEIIVYCRSGGRSTTACGKLQRNGFSKILNLEGGILSYSDEADPSIPKY